MTVETNNATAIALLSDELKFSTIEKLNQNHIHMIFAALRASYR